MFVLLKNLSVVRNLIFPQCFFSSSEHNVLKGSFYGGDVSVVHRVLCVVNNFFKHLLLPNRWANLDQTWQECVLEGPLQSMFTELDSIKNSGCHGNEIEFLSNSLKIFSGTAGLISK